MFWMHVLGDQNRPLKRCEFQLSTSTVGLVFVDYNQLMFEYFVISRRKHMSSNSENSYLDNFRCSLRIQLKSYLLIRAIPYSLVYLDDIVVVVFIFFLRNYMTSRCFDCTSWVIKIGPLSAVSFNFLLLSVGLVFVTFFFFLRKLSVIKIWNFVFGVIKKRSKSSKIFGTFLRSVGLTSHRSAF